MKIKLAFWIKSYFIWLLVVIGASLLPIIFRKISTDLVLKCSSNLKTLENFTPCSNTFGSSLEENLKVIQDYPFGDAKQYLITANTNYSTHQTKCKIPIFATAFDSTHYRESQGLLKSLHESVMSNQKYEKDLLIIVYDLGLHPSQAEMIQRNCKCEYRRFPFENYPPHVRTLTTYAFKPIIVNLLFKEYDFVWWVDASVRFITDNIDTVIEKALLYSILYKVPKTKASTGTLTKHTMRETFLFLRERRCKFKQFREVFATSLIFHADRISRVVVQAWVKCALNKECIAPDGSERKLKCDSENSYEVPCHRFDQSVIGIIIRRLFREQNDYVLLDHYEVKRGDTVQTFINSSI